LASFTLKNNGLSMISTKKNGSWHIGIAGFCCDIAPLGVLQPLFSGWETCLCSAIASLTSLQKPMVFQRFPKYQQSRQTVIILEIIKQPLFFAVLEFKESLKKHCFLYESWRSNS